MSAAERVYGRCQRTNETRRLRRPWPSRQRMEELRHMLEIDGNVLEWTFPRAIDYLRQLVEWYDSTVEDEK